MNLFSLAKKFPNEDAALLHLIKIRWPRGVRCLACDHDKCYLIETKGKTGKPARLQNQTSLQSSQPSTC
jgi:hypothetical protein